MDFVYSTMSGLRRMDYVDETQALHGAALRPPATQSDPAGRSSRPDLAAAAVGFRLRHNLCGNGLRSLDGLAFATRGLGGLRS